MLSFLKNHPFAVEAFFEKTLVLTFAALKEELQPLLPECLVLDVFNDKYAFVAIAMVNATSLRPKGFPAKLGNDFFLVGYRIFVRYKSSKGKNLRGLHIIKSEVDKKKMELLGNIFTHYNYSTIDIEQTLRAGTEVIESKRANFRVVIDNCGTQAALPIGSPFTNFVEARRFAGPLPFTFSFNEQSKQVLIIEGVRENWIPQPVNVIEYNFPFLQAIGINTAALASAFKIENIPYSWRKGKIEQWIK